LKIKSLHILFIVIITFFAINQQAKAETITIDFEGLNDSTAVSNQYFALGVNFSSATVLTVGIGLNEFEFPPNSGVNVVFDDGGPISLSFITPVLSFGGYFTYLIPITIDAYDSGSSLIGSISSLFFSNLALSGDPGSSPNEFLQIAYTGGISSINIVGDPDFGGSFTMDDVTFNAVPEPSTILLVSAGIVALAITRRRFIL
jgi:hypothetical protein